jgi:hypothetical protein
MVLAIRLIGCCRRSGSKDPARLLEALGRNLQGKPSLQATRMRLLPVHLRHRRSHDRRCESRRLESDDVQIVPLQACLGDCCRSPLAAEATASTQSSRHPPCPAARAADVDLRCHRCIGGHPRSVLRLARDVPYKATAATASGPRSSPWRQRPRSSASGST